MRIWLGQHRFVVDVNHLSGVTVGFAFDVTALGVVNFARGLFGACCDFACDFQHVVGHGSAFSDDNRMRAVFVFEVKPYIVRRCDFEGKFVVLNIVFASVNVESVHKIDVGRFGFFFTHLVFR